MPSLSDLFKDRRKAEYAVAGNIAGDIVLIAPYGVVKPVESRVISRKYLRDDWNIAAGMGFDIALRVAILAAHSRDQIRIETADGSHIIVACNGDIQVVATIKSVECEDGWSCL